jgi:multidrug efflux pump
MYALGYSINVLTLLGLVLAIGLVVDDAIVVLENVHRRTELGEPSLVAAITGTREIGFAVIATTMTLISVFVPISFLPGDLGRLFREFGFTLAACVAFSALVALSLTPMLASRLPHDTGRTGFAHAVDQAFRALARFYDRTLRRIVTHPWGVLAVLGVAVVAGVWTFTRLPSEFAPTADVGRGFIGIEAPEGSSFNYMDAYARQLEDILGKEMEKGDIERMLIRVPGQGGADLRTGDVNTARGIVIMKPWHDRERSTMDVSRTIMSEARKNIPGVRASVGQPASLGRRGQAGSPVQAVIGGPDYDQLAQWSD